MKRFIYVLIMILIVVAAMVIVFSWPHPHHENPMPESEGKVYATYNVTGKGEIEFEVNSTWTAVGIEVYYDPYKIKGGYVSLLGPTGNVLENIQLKHTSQPSGIWVEGGGVGTEFFKLKGTTCKVQYNIVGDEPVRIDIMYE